MILKTDKMTLLGVSLILLFFIFDHMSKIYISKHIAYGSYVKVVGGFFDIVNIHNRGIAFGFLSNLPEMYRVIFLCGISFVVFLIIVYLIIFGKDRNFLYILSLALLGGGALGNLYDRVFNGYVVDFLDFYIKRYHYPAFNLADTFISIGIFFLVLYKLKVK